MLRQFSNYDLWSLGLDKQWIVARGSQDAFACAWPFPTICLRLSARGPWSPQIPCRQNSQRLKSVSFEWANRTAKMGSYNCTFTPPGRPGNCAEKSLYTHIFLVQNLSWLGCCCPDREVRLDCTLSRRRWMARGKCRSSWKSAQQKAGFDGWVFLFVLLIAFDQVSRIGT